MYTVLKNEKLLRNKIKDIPEKEIQCLANDLLSKLVFLEEALSELQVQISEHGYVENYQNGENQKGVKTSSYVQTYQSFQKLYLQTSKQLQLILQPKGTSGVKKKEVDPLLELLS